MTTDMAYHAHNMDHTFILNSLYEMAQGGEKIDSQDLWQLTKTALHNVKQLQTQLHLAHTQLGQKDARIEELEQLVTTDELTQILNRRGFIDTLEREIDRTNRGLSQGGLLIMIDLDNFKIINDTYGHCAGDDALKLVASTLQAYIRKMDVTARLGGDEFVVLFANAKKEDSLDRAQKLARKLNSLTVKYKGHRIPVRASVGIQPYHKGNSIEGLLSKADACMYEEKEKRKDKKAQA